MSLDYFQNVVEVYTTCGLVTDGSLVDVEQVEFKNHALMVVN